MKKLLPVLFLAAIGFVPGLKAQTYTNTAYLSATMDYPVAFDIAPDGRFFCTQKGGNFLPTIDAQIKVYNASGTYIGVFYDLTDSVNADFERGLLGICLDPDFTNNHYVYVYYNYNSDSQNGTGDERIRITRFTEVNNVGTAPMNIFDLDVSNSIAGNHVGGNLHFRPSDPNNIYFTIGDLAYQQSNPTLNYANKLTNPYGKHLRIGKSGLNVVPTDNPFYDDGNPLATNCDWIWSYGHRNPFDFTFSTVSDSLYSSENGLNTWDEMNMVHKGSFYGWANCEGNYVNGSTTTPCGEPNDVLPIEDWGSPLPALTGILYYSSQVMPEFDNHVLVADNDYGRIYDITLGNSPVYDQFISRVTWMDVVTPGGLTTLKQGSDGCVYAMKGGYTTTGQIHRICPQGLYTEDNNLVFNELKVSPNPASGEFELTYSISRNAKVTGQLFDITGRKVADLFSSEQRTGAQRMTFNSQTLGLTAGAYICTLQGEGISSTVKLLIAE
ncbi:MAG: hypothetical protein FD123_1403 [Bacteroidetes bacterium]|nr:MAG: hypothetical protein FD123_1403 [Bacteroidota bacterium]